MPGYLHFRAVQITWFHIFSCLGSTGSFESRDIWEKTVEQFMDQIKYNHVGFHKTIKKNKL